MKVISVRLPEGTHDELIEQADRLGLAPAVMARALIKGSLDAGVDLVINPSLPEEAGLTTTTPPSKTRRSKKQKKRR